MRKPAFGLEGHGVKASRPQLPRRDIAQLGQGEEPEAPGYAKGQGVVLVTPEKDPFDVWWDWINEGRLNGFPNIPARIRNAVMMLTPEERKDRAIVNETVRTQMSPLRPAMSADRHGVPMAEE
jgi:hypothetical protein